MGRDYDAAVLAAGTCGFGMGATPNAMANMQAICDRYAPSVKAYLIIPLIGSLFGRFFKQSDCYLFLPLFYQSTLTTGGFYVWKKREKKMKKEVHL